MMSVLALASLNKLNWRIFERSRGITNLRDSREFDLPNRQRDRSKVLRRRTSLEATSHKICQTGCPDRRVTMPARKLPQFEFLNPDGTEPYELWWLAD
jgi:hypothetical protein